MSAGRLRRSYIHNKQRKESQVITEIKPTQQNKAGKVATFILHTLTVLFIWFGIPITFFLWLIDMGWVVLTK